MRLVEYRVLVRKEPILARGRNLETYFQTGKNISKTAKLLEVSPNTVRKVVNRFIEEGIEGLNDKSCRPKPSPLKTSENR